MSHLTREFNMIFSSFENCFDLRGRGRNGEKCHRPKGGFYFDDVGVGSNEELLHIDSGSNHNQTLYTLQSYPRDLRHSFVLYENFP